MSGMYTGAKHALLHITDGLNIETYASFEELAWQALWWHAIEARAQQRAAFGPGAEAKMCDYYLGRAAALTAEVSKWIVETYDPARLRAPEVWPWCDAQSGAKLAADRWYGFSDSGGLCSSFDGYDTAEACRVACVADWGGETEEDGGVSFSTAPEDLGGVAICVLTGRQYVDRLYALAGPGGSGWELSDYGHWSEPAPVEKHAFRVEVPAVEGVTDEELLHALGSAVAEYTGTVMRAERPAVTSLVNKAEVSPVEKHALEQTDSARWADARTLAKQINDLLYAKGAPLGSDTYFAIRQLLAAELRKEPR